jgi:hypothetical protein
MGVSAILRTARSRETLARLLASQTVMKAASGLIDERINSLGDWRAEVLTRVRALIRAAAPDIVEEWKWENPVWSHNGIVCTGETYKNTVKLTFAKGAALKDPSGLFNSSLEGKVRRAIDIHQGEQLDEAALKNLVRSAMTLNTSVRPKHGQARSLRGQGLR